MKAYSVSNRVITLNDGKKCWVVIKNGQRKNKQFLWLQVEKVSNVDFKESEHPRDEGGKFTSKGASGDVGHGSEKGSKDVSSGTLKLSSPEGFKKSIESAKASNPENTRWRVDIHENYGNIKKLYTSEKGSTVAVEDDGNIVSVCKKAGDDIRGIELIKKAVDAGGDRLDAFSGLYGFYAKCGFEPVSWCEFDENYAPEGWDKNRDKKEPVIFWKYTGKEYRETEDSFFKRVKPSKDYDEAKKVRDENMKGKKIK